MRAHRVERAIELPRPRTRDRVVERHHQIGLRRVPQARLDHLPRLQVVRERDRAEVVAERRAGLRGGRERRRHAGFDAQLDGRPLRVARFVERFEHGRGHREHAGVARRHDRDAPALGRQFERMARALHFLAIVGAVHALIHPERPGHRHVGRVAEDVGGVRQRRARPA
jgi:hypothetical protein